jgi:5-methyltetrahydrofolate--homocysteine methyltransferase
MIPWHELSGKYTQWWNHRLGRPLVGFWAGPKPPRPNPYNVWTAAYPFDIPAEKVIADFTVSMENTEFFADSYPRFFPNFGAGDICASLGARPDIQADTIWFFHLKDITLETLELRLDRRHAWYNRIHDMLRAACRLLPREVPVAFSDIGGNLDILASLIGTEQLLTELYDQPHLVRKAVHAITDIWLDYYQTQYEIISQSRPGTCTWAPALWAPGKMFMLQSDFSYMISPGMFEEFVRPDLVRCCDMLDYPFYHLDGPGQLPHLPSLLKIEKLRGIQWVPGTGNPPPPQWPEVLKKIIDAGKLIQCFVTVKEALEILDRFPGEYFTLTIIEGNPDPEDLKRLLKWVE